jgi:thiamine biosynthesis protein ThiI
MSKEEIIARAEKIGTYETSILPFEDCCVLFSPPHPVLRGNPDEALKIYGELDAEGLIVEALGNAEKEKCSFPGNGIRDQGTRVLLV